MRTLLVVAGLLIGCRHSTPAPEPTVQLTEPQKTTVRQMIDDTRKRLDAAEAKRDAAFDHAAALKPAEVPCSVTREGLGIPPDITPNGLITALVGMTRLSPPNSKDTKHTGVVWRNLDSDVYSITKKLDGTLDYGQTAESFIEETKRSLDRLRVSDLELALVMDRFVDAKKIDDSQFRGGMAHGQLYLWSEKAGAIVCLGEVLAESAGEVTVHTNRDDTQEANASMHQAELTGDLLVRTIDSGINALHAVAK